MVQIKTIHLTDMYKTYVLAEDFVRLEIKVNELDDVNADLNAELHIKNKIIENLTKVIKSQEEEIAELKKEEYLDKKRRAWHY